MPLCADAQRSTAQRSQLQCLLHVICGSAHLWHHSTTLMIEQHSNISTKVWAIQSGPAVPFMPRPLAGHAKQQQWSHSQRPWCTAQPWQQQGAAMACITITSCCSALKVL